MLIHFAGIAIISMIPGAGILLPFIIWYFRKGESSWLDSQAKTVLNFQITWAIGTLVILAFAYILSFVLIGILLYPFVGLLIIGNMLLSLYGGVKAYRGEYFKYPVSFVFFD